MNLRFSVYKHRLVYDDDKLLVRHFIVLKDEDGFIQKWTDFDKYARGGRTATVRSITSDNSRRCMIACKLLNYVFFDKYHIERLVDIEIDMVKEFVRDYGLCRLPDDTEKTSRTKESVEMCVREVMDFILFLIEDDPECKIKKDDLYREEEVTSRRRGTITKRVPVFEVLYKPTARTILRDMPEEAFQIIMDEIVANHRNILMLAALGAFAGLRPSEACNVRRIDSKMGPGIVFKHVDGEVIGVDIDLRYERPLRSDLVNVGGIKKHRIQKVYPAFLEAFMSCYNLYMDFIKDRPYEEEYGPLTTANNGKAYTYYAYRIEFQNAVNDCIPAMLASHDHKTVNFGFLLLENNISPHILRHWFTVKLLLYGEDEAGLMNWRGDKSVTSAHQYLMNKGELVREFEHINGEILNYELWRAEMEHNDRRR